MKLKVKDVFKCIGICECLVFVIEGGCGAFIALSRSGTIALFWPVSPEGGSSIRRSRRSECQRGLVWDWVSTATWSSEHRNAIVPLSRLWPDQGHMQTHIHLHRRMHGHIFITQYAREARDTFSCPPKLWSACFPLLSLPTLKNSDLWPDTSSTALYSSWWLLSTSSYKA